MSKPTNNERIKGLADGFKELATKTGALADKFEQLEKESAARNEAIKALNDKLDRLALQTVGQWFK